MAERRMFAKSIIDSDAFLEMPQSTQLLYFHLSMRADDDGFINQPKAIMRLCGAKDDDMTLLVAKKFIIPFENGVVVIKHWRIHNYIQKDRYTETHYKELKDSLFIDENGAYTTNESARQIDVDKETIKKIPISDARQKRIDAKKESDLPYSFEYKIKNAFSFETCPICGCTMRPSDPLRKPTIQHNKPISLGGKHEIDNISVICLSCNTSIQNRKESGALNNALVKQKWAEIQAQERDCSGIGYTGKDSIGKYSIDNINNGQIIPPTLEMVKKYCEEKNYKTNPQDFCDFYDSKGWFVGKNKMKDWHKSLSLWERNNHGENATFKKRNVITVDWNNNDIDNTSLSEEEEKNAKELAERLLGNK